MTREQALTGARSQSSLFITWVQTIQSLNQLAAGGGLGSVPGYGEETLVSFTAEKSGWVLPLCC